MEQIYVQVIFMGDVFEMLVGIVGFVFGFEFCEQCINFINDVMCVFGFGVLEILDMECLIIGCILFYEVFVEIEVLVIDNLFFLLFGCFIEYEIFGVYMIYSGKVDWQLMDSFCLCLIYGIFFCVLNLCE